MHITFESNDPQAAQLRELSETRLRFVMRRLAWLVPHAKLHLADINGPHGGVDKRCRLELNTEQVGTVIITSVARDWRSALEQALARASQNLVRQWQRKTKEPKNRVRVLTRSTQFTL